MANIFVRMLERAQAMVRGFMERGAIRPELSPEEATDFLDAVMHGLTAAHMANQPGLPAGEGRFGSLIPVAIRVLQAARGNQGGSDHSGARCGGAGGLVGRLLTVESCGCDKNR